jgi:hypothetical protein
MVEDTHDGSEIMSFDMGMRVLLSNQFREGVIIPAIRRIYFNKKNSHNLRYGVVVNIARFQSFT